MSMTFLVAILTALIFFATKAWDYYRVKRIASFLSNEEFKRLLPKSQVIDIRDSASFKRKHILGARNFPFGQLAGSLSSLRKDKPVLLYDTSSSRTMIRAILVLKKAGYTDLAVLQNGFDYWDGKVKEGK